MITLEKIDQIVERTGVSYAQAKEALDKTNGDVIDAIIYIEENTPTFTKKVSENVNLKKDEVLYTLKELLRKGNVTKIIVEKKGKRYLEVPVNIAVSAGALSLLIGIAILPVVAVIGVGLYIGDFRIKVVKDDGSEVDVNEETQKRILLLKGKVENSKVNEVKDDLIDITKEVMKGAKDGIKDVQEDVKDNMDAIKDNVVDIKNKVGDKVKDNIENIKEKMDEKKEKREEIKNKVEDIKEDIKDKAQEVKEDVKDKVEDVKEKANEVKEEAKDKADEVKEEVKDKVEDTKKDIKDKVEDIKNNKK